MALTATDQPFITCSWPEAKKKHATHRTGSFVVNIYGRPTREEATLWYFVLPSIWRPESKEKEQNIWRVTVQRIDELQKNLKSKKIELFIKESALQ